MLLNLLILIHKIKLFFLIEYDAEYDKILKEIRLLDKYIIKLFRKQLL